MISHSCTAIDLWELFPRCSLQALTGLGVPGTDWDGGLQALTGMGAAVGSVPMSEGMHSDLI